jgi:hypothetical protein
VGEDIKIIYDYLSEHKAVKPAEVSAEDILGPKGTSCRQWINALTAYKTRAENERAYWEDIEQATIISNRTFGNLTCGQLKRQMFTISEGLTEQIKQVSHKELETRIDAILLAALNTIFYKMSGIKNHCVTMENHGRQEFAGDIDVSHTMGWFAAPYPLKLPQPGNNLKETLSKINETLRMVPNEGIGSKALWLNEKKAPCLPKISFNYQGEFNDKMDLDIDYIDLDALAQFDFVLDGHISRKKLIFNLVTKLPEDKIVKFIKGFNDTLEELVHLYDSRIYRFSGTESQTVTVNAV